MGTILLGVAALVILAAVGHGLRGAANTWPVAMLAVVILAFLILLVTAAFRSPLPATP
jgi:hypothetical protein